MESKNLTYGSIVPLIGGESLGISESLGGQNPEWVLSYSDFEANDAHYLNYLRTKKNYTGDYVKLDELLSVSDTTILNDVAGDSRFSTNGVSFSLAPSFIFKKSIIGIGIQGGVYQRAINYNNLIFLEDEYLERMKFSFLDFSFVT